MTVKYPKQNADQCEARLRRLKDLEKRLKAQVKNEQAKDFEQGRSGYERLQNEKFNYMLMVFIALVLFLVVIQQVLAG